VGADQKPLKEPVDFPAELEPVLLRLARADELVFQIGELSAQWSMRGPLEIEQRRRGDQFKAILTGIRPVPPLLWLLFSEAINHLRAAIDNTVWYLFEQAHGPIDGPAAARVAMPIHSKPEQYEKWCKRRREDRLHELLPDCELGSRIRKLQPFVDDDAVVPSNGELVAHLQGDAIEYAHALTLLQGYSNADKHRAIRVAVTRSVASRPDRPFAGQDLRFRELQTGQVLASGTWGELLPIETNTAVMVQRPDPYVAMVPPARELGLLHQYVARVAVPFLTFGLELPGAIPPQAELGDTGETAAERISRGRWEFATDRLKTEMVRMYQEAMSDGPKFLPVVDEDRHG